MKTTYCLVVAALLASATVDAHATSLTYSYTGRLGGVSNPENLPGIGVFNSVVHGTISFDENLVDLFPSDNEIDLFDSSLAANSGFVFSATFNSGTYSDTIADASVGFLFLEDRPSSNRFSFRAQRDALTFIQLAVNDDASGNLIPGGLNGNSNYNLADLVLSSATNDLFQYRLASGGGVIANVSFSIETLTPIPLPGALFLFWSALAGLLAMKRLRRF